MKNNQKYEIAILVELHSTEYRVDTLIGEGKNISEAIEDVSHTYRIFEGSAVDEEGAIFAFEILHVRKMIGEYSNDNLEREKMDNDR